MSSRLRHSASVVTFYVILFGALFFPVLRTGRLLAPGDGVTEYLPAFYARWTLWDPTIFSGFPTAADPAMHVAYYLPGLLFSWLHAWNAYSVCAYVMAACFTYGYVFALTRSVVPSLVGGTVYSMSGFFMGHLGHAQVVHGAAWTPLLLWALEKLRARADWRWMVAASAAVAQQAMGPHPQMLVHSLQIGIAYVLVVGWTAAHPWRYFRVSAVAVLLGLGIGAVQILPCVELTRLSHRALFPYEAAVAFALPLMESTQLVFPYVFGGPSWTTPYFGTWGLVETAGYMGLLPLMAAVVAAHDGRRVLIAFWATVTLVTVLLALGDATPLAHAWVSLAPLKGLRCPGRHLGQTALAIATLAGLGIATLQRDPGAATRRAWGAAVVVCVLSAGIAVWLALHGDALRLQAAARGVSVPLLPWDNPAIGIPLVVAVVSAVVTIWYAGRPSSRWRAAVLIAVVGLDLGSVGRFMGWQTFSIDPGVVHAPDTLAPYRERLAASGTRVMSYEGINAPREAAPPDLNRLWAIPNATGYGSIPLVRYVAALRWDYPPSLERDNRVLDILATRYLMMTRPAPGVEPREDRDIAVDAAHRVLQFESLPNVAATEVAIVATLARATAAVDGTATAILRVTTADGEMISMPIRAGDDVSEWGYDRDDVRPVIRHRRARVVRTSPAPDDRGGEYPGYDYEPVFDLHGEHRVTRVEIEWTGSADQVFLRRVVLRNARTGESYPLIRGLTDPEHWRYVEDLREVQVYENLRALPRAWMVARVVTLPPEQILNAIRDSRMPDGSRFEPRQVALIEEPSGLGMGNGDLNAQVAVTRITDTRVDLRAQSTGGGFVVLSDINYPGWRASIDGRRTRIYQTDYLLRGVVVPPGEHAIAFSFMPWSFYVGLGISGVSVLALFTACWFPRWS